MLTADVVHCSDVGKSPRDPTEDVFAWRVAFVEDQSCLVAHLVVAHWQEEDVEEARSLNSVVFNTRNNADKWQNVTNIHSLLQEPREDFNAGQFTLSSEDLLERDLLSRLNLLARD